MEDELTVFEVGLGDRIALVGDLLSVDAGTTALDGAVGFACRRLEAGFLHEGSESLLSRRAQTDNLKNCRVLRFFVGFTLLFATIYVVFEPAERPGFNLIGVGNSPPFFRDEETITTVYKQFSALKVLSSTILTFCTFRQFPVALEITCFYRFVIGSGHTTKALKSLGFKAFLFPFFRPKTDIYHFFITIDLDSMIRSDVSFLSSRDPI